MKKKRRIKKKRERMTMYSRNMYVNVLLLLGMMITPAIVVASFSDVQGHQFQQYIEVLQSRSVIEGYPDGTFKPNALVNRAEFLKMLTIASGKNVQTEVSRCFVDFTGDEQWFWTYACSAKTSNFLNGHPDGTFRGETPVNLAEALKMSLEAWNVLSSDGVILSVDEEWYDPYFDAAASTLIFTKIPRIPDLQLTRAEVAVLLSIIDPKSSYSSLSSVASAKEDSSSYSYTPPIYHGALRIEQRPLATLNTTTGKKDVLLLAFDAVAGRQDVFITQLKFTSDAGSLLSGTNYRLVHRGKSIGTAIPQNEMLTFIDINLPVEDGVLESIELRGDVQQSGGASFSVRFAEDQPDYVLGTDAVDGREVTGIETNNAVCPTVSICWIAVYTSASRLISLGGTPGSVYVTEDTTPVRSHQLLAGMESDVLLRLNVRAIDEDITLKKIRIGGGTASIDSLQLYTIGSSMPFAIARKSGCETVIVGQFCANVAITILKDQDTDILVRAKMNAQTSGATSGDLVALALSASTTGESVAIDAEGTSTLMELVQNDGDATEEGEVIIGRSSAGTNSAVVGPTHDVVFAKIVSILNVHADPDYSAVPVGMSNFATFRFSSKGTKNAVLKSIEFRVTSTNVQFASDSMEVFNTGNSTVSASCAQSAITGIITVLCSYVDASSINTVINNGGSVELSLRGNIMNSQIGAGTSTLQAQIQGLGNRSTPGPIIWNDEVVEFEWVDIEESSVRSTLYRNQ